MIETLKVKKDVKIEAQFVTIAHIDLWTVDFVPTPLTNSKSLASQKYLFYILLRKQLLSYNNNCNVCT